MLSYQHAFHAGNFADVHKHTVLTFLLTSLLKKPSPFCYVETHAGRARYDFQTVAAQKNREHEQGIYRLLQAKADGSDTRRSGQAVVNDYLAQIKSLNPEIGPPRHYPGSPLLAQAYLRAGDSMLLAELHPQEHSVLRREFKIDKRIAVHQRDGYEMLRGLLPPQPARGLVLIDPSYETVGDVSAVVAALNLIEHRWRSAMALVWYPILSASTSAALITAAASTTLHNLWRCELHLKPLDGPPGMKGSGLLLLHPPWQGEAVLRELMPWLAQYLGDQSSAAHWRLEQVRPE
ncbi:MAG: 23S rRNA (adenine(2030)-N(6))-methyltransferase RlmJ [Gammaproteobacteria bacterium]|nr:23S rRNA (adenine(2030)-N(6))-methyltransferase RlmJ [Gammaproteobacteria bacterium]